MRRGAHGYVLKSEVQEALLPAVPPGRTATYRDGIAWLIPACDCDGSTIFWIGQPCCARSPREAFPCHRGVPRSPLAENRARPDRVPPAPAPANRPVPPMRQGTHILRSTTSVLSAIMDCKPSRCPTWHTYSLVPPCCFTSITPPHSGQAWRVSVAMVELGFVSATSCCPSVSRLSPMLNLVSKGAISFSRRMYCTFKPRMALSGIDRYAASSGSCTTVTPPRWRISHNPAAPSSSMPVRTTPAVRSPKTAAAERNITLMLGR